MIDKKLVIRFDHVLQAALFEVPTADPDFGRADYPLNMLFNASLEATEDSVDLRLSIDARKARIYAAAFAQLADELDAEAATPATAAADAGEGREAE